MTFWSILNCFKTNDIPAPLQVYVGLIRWKANSDG